MLGDDWCGDWRGEMPGNFPDAVLGKLPGICSAGELLVFFLNISFRLDGGLVPGGSLGAHTSHMR